MHLLCSNTMDNVNENIDNYNPRRDKKSLNCFDMISDIVTHKRFQTIIKKLFIRC